MTFLPKYIQNLFHFRKDLNEFFEYCTEWEPTNSLYFGDNILQDVLAPKRFTSTIDSVVVSEEMLAEGIHGKEELSHPDKGPILELKRPKTQQCCLSSVSTVSQQFFSSVLKVISQNLSRSRLWGI